jgi:hypothetical protein
MADVHDSNSVVLASLMRWDEKLVAEVCGVAHIVENRKERWYSR